MTEMDRLGSLVSALLIAAIASLWAVYGGTALSVWKAAVW